MSGSDEDDGATLPRPAMREPRCGTQTRAVDPCLGPDAQDRIGRDLRRMYEALLLEPLPERILDLVARLGRTPRRTLQ
jgi:anti-sigma factor NepR-like protein